MTDEDEERELRLSLACPVCRQLTPLVALSADGNARRYVPCHECGTRLYVDEADPLL